MRDINRTHISCKKFVVMVEFWWLRLVYLVHVCHSNLSNSVVLDLPTAAAL